MTREEAIKLVKQIKGAMVYTEEEKKALETLIPELCENEDERIIKKLQEYVKNRNWSLNGPTQDEVLAWLEKQKEQKIISQEDFDMAKYKVLCGEPNLDLEIASYTEKNVHLPITGKNEPMDIMESDWIKCAKFFYNLGKKQKEQKFTDETMQEKDRIDSSFTKMKQKEQKPGIEVTLNDIAPFEKEFRRLCGAYNIKLPFGRPFDVHHLCEDLLKFLKKKEQKPTEWSEKYITDVFEKVGLAKIVREQGNDELTNAVQSAMLELSKGYKQEWSKEDEEMLSFFDEILGYAYNNNPRGFRKSMLDAKMWLKSLKNRGNFPKSNTNSPNGWSKEDIEMIKIINHKLSDVGCLSDTVFNAKYWITNLPHRINLSHWKPSEEQMDALYCAKKEYHPARIKARKALETLYNNLKRLED